MGVEDGVSIPKASLSETQKGVPDSDSKRKHIFA